MSTFFRIEDNNKLSVGGSPYFSSYIYSEDTYSKIIIYQNNKKNHEDAYSHSFLEKQQIHLILLFNGQNRQKCDEILDEEHKNLEKEFEKAKNKLIDLEKKFNDGEDVFPEEINSAKEKLINSQIDASCANRVVRFYLKELNQKLQNKLKEKIPTYETLLAEGEKEIMRDLIEVSFKEVKEEVREKKKKKEFGEKEDTLITAIIITPVYTFTAHVGGTSIHYLTEVNGEEVFKQLPAKKTGEKKEREVNDLSFKLGKAKTDNIILLFAITKGSMQELSMNPIRPFIKEFLKERIYLKNEMERRGGKVEITTYADTITEEACKNILEICAKEDKQDTTLVLVAFPSRVRNSSLLWKE